MIVTRLTQTPLWALDKRVGLDHFGTDDFERAEIHWSRERLHEMAVKMRAAWCAKQSPRARPDRGHEGRLSALAGDTPVFRITREAIP